MKKCPKCKETKNLKDFYKRRKNADPSTYCKPCSNKQTIERQRKFKKLCVEYKGGQCSFCGYKKSMNALEFHHVDPSEKSFSISKARLTKFDHRVKKELDKCQLLCANCHRELEENMG